MKNQALITAIQTFLNNQNQINEKDFFNELNKAILYMPIEKNEEKGVTLRTLKNNEGNTFLPFFTDEDMIGDFKSEMMEIDFEQLSYFILQNKNEINGILNPFQQAIVLTAEMVQAITNLCKDDNKERISLGMPMQEPVEMEEALSTFMKEHSTIHSATMFMIQVQGERKANLLLVIEHDEKEEELFPQLAEVTKAFLKDDEKMSFTSTTSELGKQTVGKREPFYQI